MSKFKEGDEIVRVKGFYKHAPRGYKTKVLKGNEYLDAEGDIININDEFWELAEDTSKPVYTKLMWQCDELLKIGMRFATEAGEYIAEYTNEKSVCFTDENGFLVAINRAYAKPIPAPIDFTDNAPYMFEVGGSKFLGFYEASQEAFFDRDDGGDEMFELCDCTNIRPMTVAESN
jgi:hypothetical protein